MYVQLVHNEWDPAAKAAKMKVLHNFGREDQVDNAETAADTTWADIAGEMDLLTLGTFTGPAGTFRQTAELTKTQRDLLAKLKIAHSKKIIEAAPATGRTNP